MPIGILSCVASVLLGGLLGAAVGKFVRRTMKENITLVFGMCSVAVGVGNIIKVNAMPSVTLALILGTAIGEALHLEKRIEHAFAAVLCRLPLKTDQIDMQQFVTVVLLFCASGFGIFGVLTEGMSGDASVLLSKAFLDLFTAVLFAGTMGISVALIAVPQAVVFFGLYFISQAAAPFITPTALLDFIACGGVITVATGLRVAGIKNMPLGSMVPALLLIFPLSDLWGMLMG